jgi:sporulation protein YlmC with PRC-barrel domain
MEHREETTNLTSGDKISGAKVYNTAGRAVGAIRDVMIDKSSGTAGNFMMQPEQRSTTTSGDEARQGVTGHNVRYVLAVSCALAAALLLAAIVYASM